MNDKKSGFLKSRSNSEKGSALLMIMTSILLLSFLMVEVIFETTLNKTKIDNLREKFQARLNAESGLTFALAQLRIYKEYRQLEPLYKHDVSACLFQLLLDWGELYQKIWKYQQLTH